MAYNAMLPQFIDGPSDVMRVTMLGSLPSLQQPGHAGCAGCAGRDAALQAGRDALMVDREVPTRDHDTLTKYSKNVDVRYFRNLRDRLRGKYYACNPQHCAGIRERHEHHLDVCRPRVPTLAAGPTDGDRPRVPTLAAGPTDGDRPRVPTLAAGPTDGDRPRVPTLAAGPTDGDRPRVPTLAAGPTDQDQPRLPTSIAGPTDCDQRAEPTLATGPAAQDRQPVPTLVAGPPVECRPRAPILSAGLTDAATQGPPIYCCSTSTSPIMSRHRVRDSLASTSASKRSRRASLSPRSIGSRSPPPRSPTERSSASAALPDPLSPGEQSYTLANITNHPGLTRASNETRVIRVPAVTSPVRDHHEDPRSSICNRSFPIEFNADDISEDPIAPVLYDCILEKSSINPPATNNTSDIDPTPQRSRVPEHSDSVGSITHALRREVEEWLQVVPIRSNLTPTAIERNASEIRHLIRNLAELSTGTVDLEQEQNLRCEIERCIDNLPVWYPGAEKVLNIFKNDLVDNLMSRINRVLLKMYYRNRVVSPLAHTAGHRASEPGRGRRVKDVVIEWLWSINMKTKNHNGMANNMSKIADLLIYRMNPLLKMTADRTLQKTFLINAIISVLHYLPININCPRYRDMHLQKFAEDLFNRLQYDVATDNDTSETLTKDELVEVSPALSDKSCLMTTSHLLLDDTFLSQLITTCLREAHIKCLNVQTVIGEIEVILEEVIDTPFANVQHRARRDIARVLAAAAAASDALASHVAKELIKRTKTIYFGDDNPSSGISQTPTVPRLTRTISVFTTEAPRCKPNDGPVTSTPKKKPKPKTVTILNSEEKEYTDKVLALIRVWVETLPETFSAPEERDFKETIIRDLAGDITDAQKVAQLTSETEEEIRKYLKYIAYRWIHRLEEIDMHEVIPHLEDFLGKLNEIPVPALTSARGGDRQAAANLVHAAAARGGDETFVPRGVDVLQDEISLWMNRQSSDIFENKGQCYKNNKIRELAQTLENKLTSKRPPTEISRDVAQWLNDMVTIRDRQEIAYLAEDLKDRVIGIPQDATMAARRDKEKKDKEEIIPLCCSPQTTVNDRSNSEEIQNDNTMKIFIDKFIEHNYDVDDHMTRVAANHLLKRNLIRLSPPARVQLYEQNMDNAGQNAFSSRQVMRELEYIKDISDWLSNIPIDPAYNTLGNRDRIDFVTNLAANIREVEEQREREPDAMDYNLYMAGIISESMRLLPMHRDLQKDSKSVTLMIDQLLTKIIAHRERVDDVIELNESTNTTGINTDNIGDFLEEFILIHGNDIGDNELKMEIWSIRLIREIKKTLAETSNMVTKGELYNNCVNNVPKPGDETAILFYRELEYIDEISDWMKNLPLLPINETGEFDKGRQICELAEKIIEMEGQNPNNLNVINKNEFQKYLTQWISQFPLDNSQTIVYPVVTEQLLKRIEKLKNNKQMQSDNQSRKYLPSTKNSQTKVKKHKIKISKSFHGSPGQILIDIIEKWAKNLPVKAENEEATKAIKDGVSVKLIQKVGELNMDPDVLNDDLLYQDMLNEEVRQILDDIPSNCNCQMAGDRDNLEADIVNSIMEAKNIIKEKTAGDAYKLKLENTIVESMPDPDQHHQNYDPGFEIYKNRLASAFILDNFDHSIDEVKIKHENNIKKEIDKYFEHAQKKNSVPLSKDELYNELYVALYKVPIPNEASVIDAVEEVKTRCEVDAWFEKLPLREADGLGELLEWDQILATIAKRIHEIEKAGNKPDSKIKKEILKWLQKLPLLPGHQNNLDHYAETLQKTLKNTAAQRKCVHTSKKSKGKKDKIKTTFKDVNQPQQTTEPSAPNKKAADVMLDLVRSWCDEIPLCLDQDASQASRDFLVTKIMLKISELNADPTVVSVDALYDRLLGDELEILLSAVETCDSFKLVKDDRKLQLMDGIKSVMPLIKEEIAHQKYKETLDKTVDEFLHKPQNLTPEKEEQFNEIKKAIIDDFVQYKYGDNDHLDKHNYKMKVEEKINKFMVDIMQNRDKDKNKDYKSIKTNELMSELANIPAHGIDFTHDIEEIRIKDELTIFFNGLGLNKSPEKSKVNQSKEILAKKLNEIEICGHSPDNDYKMKQEILKSLSKLKKEVKPQAVDAFLKKLRTKEDDRRGTPSNTNNNVSCQQCCGYGAAPQPRHLWKGLSSTGNKNAVCQYEHATNYDAVTQSPTSLSGNSSDADGSRATDGRGKRNVLANQRRQRGSQPTADGGKDEGPCHCRGRGGGGRRSKGGSRGGGTRRRPFLLAPPWYMEGCYPYMCRMPYY